MQLIEGLCRLQLCAAQVKIGHDKSQPTEQHRGGHKGHLNSRVGHLQATVSDHERLGQLLDTVKPSNPRQVCCAAR
jgi:hypothetical protein